MFTVEELQLLPSPEPVKSPGKMEPVSAQRERGRANGSRLRPWSSLGFFWLAKSL